VLAINEDLAKDKDKIKNTEVVKMMLADHPDWVENAGIAYDASLDGQPASSSLLQYS
jgi:hypothetical protein